VSGSSPFLHQESTEQRKGYRENAQRIQLEQQIYRGSCTLERLRYKRYYAHAIDLHWRLMQHIGDFGRQFVGWWSR